MIDLGALLGRTLREPRLAAREILALDLPMQARWMALALVVVLSVALTQVGFMLLPLPETSIWGAWMQNMLLAVPLQVGFLTLVAFGMTHVGRRFGGNARFDDALILVAWLEAVLLVVQVAQLFAVLALPVLALGIGIASVALFFWLLTNFTAEANGFASLARVFFGIVATIFLAAFALVALLSLLGANLPTPGA